MALKKRGAVWHLRIRPFRDKQIWVSTGTFSKAKAEDIEREVMVACRSQDYHSLTPAARAVCVALYRNQGWRIPDDLLPTEKERPEEELTLWRASEICLRHPDVCESQNRERMEEAFVHIVKHFGKAYRVKSLWIPGIKEYQHRRLAQGAAASTINKEKATLSKMFQTLIEYQLVPTNPCRYVRNLSEKDGQRQVYLGFKDYQLILEELPCWFVPVVQTAFYTGMRRGEIVGLTRSRLNLSKRMLYLGPQHTKERDFKRVPIHSDLLPVFEEVLRVRSFGNDKAFLIEGRPLCEDSFQKPWTTGVKNVGLNPRPTFNDLRHAFIANCRRSGMSHDILQSIVGHWHRMKPVSERYGRISDQELIDAIDTVSFDHGPSEIFVSSQEERAAVCERLSGSSRKR